MKNNIQKAASKLDPGHKVTFGLNDFLHSPQGQELSSQLTQGFPEVQAAVQNQIDTHKTIMDQLGLGKKK